MSDTKKSPKRITNTKKITVPSGFEYFCEDLKHEVVDHLFGDKTSRDRQIYEECKTRWNRLTSSEQEKYVTKGNDVFYQSSLNFTRLGLEKARVVETKKVLVVDKNRPKKPLSGYLRFSALARSKITKKNPNASPSKIMKLLGEAWSKYSESKKKTLKEEYQKEMKVWKEEVEQYDEEHPPQYIEKEVKKKRKREEKDPNKPAPPLTTFLRFCQDQRPLLKEKHPKLKGKEITEKIGEMWNNLAEKEKNKYKDAYTKERAIWAPKLEAYYEQYPDKAPQKRKKSDSKKTTTKATKTTTKSPKKKEVLTISRAKKSPAPAKDAFFYFSKGVEKKIKNKHPSSSKGSIKKKIASMWKKVTDKTMWEELAKKDKKRFKKEKAALEGKHDEIESSDESSEEEGESDVESEESEESEDSV